MGTEATNNASANENANANADSTKETGSLVSQTAKDAVGKQADGGSGKGEKKTEGNKSLLAQSQEDKSKDGVDQSKDGQSKPVEYQNFKLPEGISLNEQLIGEFKNVAKGLNLSQEQAQKLIDLQTKGMIEAKQAQDAAYAEIKKEWRDEVTKELGANFKAEMFKANKALDTFGTPELREEMEAAGLLDNPQVLRFLRNVGGAISEDTHAGGEKKPGPRSLAERMYGKN